MSNVINLDEYRKSNQLEEEYLKFLSHVNKFVGVPTDIPQLAKAFYFTLRYLDGHVNALSILSMIKICQEGQIVQTKEMVVKYLESLEKDLTLI